MLQKIAKKITPNGDRTSGMTVSIETPDGEEGRLEVGEDGTSADFSRSILRFSQRRRRDKSASRSHLAPPPVDGRSSCANLSTGQLDDPSRGGGLRNFGRLGRGSSLAMWDMSYGDLWTSLGGHGGFYGSFAPPHPSIADLVRPSGRSIFDSRDQSTTTGALGDREGDEMRRPQTLEPWLILASRIPSIVWGPLLLCRLPVVMCNGFPFRLRQLCLADLEATLFQVL